MGTSELTFVDANFPEERAFGRTNLRVEVDGREVTPASLPAQYQDARARRAAHPARSALGAQANAQTHDRIHVPFARKLRRADHDRREWLSSRHARMVPGASAAETRARSRIPIRPRLRTSLFACRRTLSSSPRGRRRARRRTATRSSIDSGSTRQAWRRTSSLENTPLGPRQGKSNSAVFWTTQPLKDDPGSGGGTDRGGVECSRKGLRPARQEYRRPAHRRIAGIARASFRRDRSGSRGVSRRRDRESRGPGAGHRQRSISRDRGARARARMVRRRDVYRLPARRWAWAKACRNMPRS